MFDFISWWVLPACYYMRFCESHERALYYSVLISLHQEHERIQYSPKLVDGGYLVSYHTKLQMEFSLMPYDV